MTEKSESIVKMYSAQSRAGLELQVKSLFYLLLDGIRRAVHPPFLERGFVLGVDHRSEGHQLEFIILTEINGMVYRVVSLSMTAVFTQDLQSAFTRQRWERPLTSYIKESLTKINKWADWNRSDRGYLDGR